jgi:hypothetical protein
MAGAVVAAGLVHAGEAVVFTRLAVQIIVAQSGEKIAAKLYGASVFLGQARRSS